MSKIKQFDSQTLTLLRSRLDETLTTLGNELGIRLAAGRCTYSPTGDVATFKLECGTIGTDGIATTKESHDWERYSEQFNLPKDGLFKTITIRGNQYKILGLCIRRQKFPVLVLDIGKNKQVLLREEDVKLALDKLKQ